MVAEAAHYRLFLDLANKYEPVVKVSKRWKEYLEYEAEIMTLIAIRGDRMH